MHYAAKYKYFAASQSSKGSRVLPDGPKEKKRRHIFTILRIAVAVVAIAVLCWKQDWDKVAKTFKQLNLWYFVLSWVMYLASQAIVGLRWWILLRAQSIRIGLTTAIRLHFLGLFWNICLPSSMGGDVVRAWYVTKHTDKKVEAALSVFVDRGVGMLCMFTIAVVSYLFFVHGRDGLLILEQKSGTSPQPAEYHWAIWAVVGLMVIIFCLVLASKKGREGLKKAWGYVVLHGEMVLKRMRMALVIYFSKPFVMLGVYLLTVLIQMMVITAFWILGVNLQMGVDAKYYFVFFPLTWALGALPISIAGLGIMEGALVGLFDKFAGAKEGTAFALAVCQRLIWFLSAFPGFIIHLCGAHLPAAREPVETTSSELVETTGSEITCPACPPKPAGRSGEQA